MNSKIECKKCEKRVEIPDGLLNDKKIIEIITFIKHHKKHGIFAFVFAGHHDVEAFYKE